MVVEAVVLQEHVIMKLQIPSHEMEIPKAFTLIEILVVIAIMGILFIAGSVNFNDFQKRKAVSGVADQIRGDLRLAQSDAITGQKPVTGCKTALDSYSFLVIPPSEYKIQINCGASLPPVKDVSLPGGITVSITSTPVTNPLNFKALGQGTNISSGSTWSLTVSKSGVTPATITVTSGGQIQ